MATVTTNQPSVTTYLPTVPITRELKVPEDLDKKLEDPWKPRAIQVRPRSPAGCAVVAMQDHAVRSTCCSISFVALATSARCKRLQEGAGRGNNKSTRVKRQPC